ncbi:uncharacterized protein LOC118405926 [Branchiostoma floridae]|uniref:Uncharacterized protein LOC118405926 n=1 Tax=Branchiostoma floridae TaxID=7739 RepID=C3YF12_BRAFL|nr:uncharacterized protein LOC118405926 [Branchiostoma floridae]|eukprot:XP_002605246.1 hypothetical protein BRAFLDRAFT_92280 [Branchiostoma floridae]
MPSSLLWWAVRVILLLVVLGFYNHHNRVEEENEALSKRVQRLEIELQKLQEQCSSKNTLDNAGVQNDSSDSDVGNIGHKEKEKETEDKKEESRKTEPSTVGNDWEFTKKHVPEKETEETNILGVKDL